MVSVPIFILPSVYVKLALPFAPVVAVPVWPLFGPAVIRKVTVTPAAGLPFLSTWAVTVCGVPAIHGFDAVFGESESPNTLTEHGRLSGRYCCSSSSSQIRCR